MAWRLLQSGHDLEAVIVENRGRMAKGKKQSLINLVKDWGFPFLFKKIWETLRIRFHYYSRKLWGKRYKDPVYLSIEELALDFPFRLIRAEDHNDKKIEEIIRGLCPDAGVLTNTRKIKKNILEIPRFGFFNLHLSELPKYAGLDSIFWALYHGEREIGVTVHTVCPEIDQGDIALQKKIDVQVWDGEASLYEKALWLGTSMMVNVLDRLALGVLEKIPQNIQVGSYFSWPTADQRRELEQRRKLTRLPSEKPAALHLITRMIRGGAQENTLATVLGLREAGYEAILATGPTWGNEGELISRALENGVPIIIINQMIRELSLHRDIVSFLKILYWLKRIKPDVVHTHTSKAGLLGRLAGRLMKVPVLIHTPHGHVFHSYFSKTKERFFLQIEQFLGDLSVKMIALTRAEKREHVDLCVGISDQWVIIPSGVDEKPFLNLHEDAGTTKTRLGVKNKSKIVGFIGRIAPVKGPRFLIEAIPAILRNNPDAFFLIIGDGEEGVKLKELASSLNILSSIRFMGHQEDIRSYLNIMDVLVVPSLNEGMGRVIVEAGFLKKAVLASRIGGIPDLIENEKTGILVDPRSPEQIAEGVMTLLQDPGKRHRMGHALYDKAISEYTESRMIEQIEILYRDELQKKGMLLPSSKPQNLPDICLAQQD